MPSSSSIKPSRPSRGRKSSSYSASRSIQKTEIKIHVYDLLPPGRLSSILWTVGSSLLHSGVVIKDKEYAYGGHDRRGVTGVYWTRPKLEPPGGTFKLEMTQGFSFYSDEEIAKVIHEVSQQFLGTSYNLLTNNCNHFTSFLCERLTSKPAPAWVNRAASIGLALPCVVPREWIAPPDHETAEGELLDEEGGEEEDERVGMLQSDQRRRRNDEARASQTSNSLSAIPGERPVSRSATPPVRLVKVKDSSGRDMPVSERAPMPRR